MKPLDIKILYLSFHNNMQKVHGRGSIIHRKDIFTKLGRQFLVPKPLRECALKELENMGLMERLDRDKIKLLDVDIDLDNSSQFFQKLNIV
jgi:hypothetical protein